MQSRSQKHPKNSDSDYKAQDQGSASDNQTWRKYKKTSYNIKMTKKDMIENSIKTLVPIGVTLKYQDKLTNQEYFRLVHMDNVDEIKCCFRCFLAKVVQVVDGESVRVVGVVGGVEVKLTLRLNGIVIPDIRKAQTKQFSTLIKKILTQMLLNKIVRIQTGQYDKSGNIFCRLYAYTGSPIHPYQCQSTPPTSNKHKITGQFCINDYMIQNDMGKGKGKNEFTKKNYEDFCQKYEVKEWPIVEDYPLELWRIQGRDVDYQERDNQDDQ